MRNPRAIEIAAWCVGLVLIFAYAGMRGWSAVARADAVAAYRDAERIPNAERIANAERLALPADGSESSTVSAAPVVAAPAVAEAPAAVLRIPSLSLEVPVDYGTDELTLARGAGHIEGTAEPGTAGNVGIAAHRDGFFRPLKDIVLDTDVYLAAGGREWRYRVVDIRIVNPEDVYVLDATSVPSVTLVTCYPFFYVGAAPRRYIVRAELEREPPRIPHASVDAATTKLPTTRGESS